MSSIQVLIGNPLLGCNLKFSSKLSTKINFDKSLPNLDKSFEKITPFEDV